MNPNRRKSHAAASEDDGTHTDRVPVDQRRLGMDKRSIGPALVVVGIILLWAVVVPLVDSAIDHDDPVRVGDRFAITDDLAVTAPSGWNVVNGFRTDALPAGGPPGSATFTNGGVTVTVSADEYDGTAAELLTQIEKVTSGTGAINSFHVVGGRSNVTTGSGLVGVAESYTGHDFEGTVAAFVADGTGLEVLVSAHPDHHATTEGQVADMIASIGPWDAADSGQEAS